MTACGLPHDGNFDYEFIKSTLGAVDTIVYVGALCGYEAARLSRTLGARRTVAIEAAPANYLKLVSRGCHEDTKMDCVLACISDRDDALVDFYVHGAYPFASSTLDTGGSKILMPPSKLSGVIGGPSGEMLLVVDAEGTPTDVMDSWGAWPRAIIVETEKDGLTNVKDAERRADVYDYLVSLGYELRAEWPAGDVPQNNSFWTLK